MTAAFVPTLNDEMEKRQRVGAFTLVNQVSSWLLVVTGALVLDLDVTVAAAKPIAG